MIRQMIGKSATLARQPMCHPLRQGAVKQIMENGLIVRRFSSLPPSRLHRDTSLVRGRLLKRSRAKSDF